MIGTTLAPYRVGAKLGEVYRATDTKLGREVAIKALPASWSREAQSLERLEREAKTLAALSHPHSTRIDGFEADQGTHFLVLELRVEPKVSQANDSSPAQTPFDTGTPETAGWHLEARRGRGGTSALRGSLLVAAAMEISSASAKSFAHGVEILLFNPWG